MLSVEPVPRDVPGYSEKNQGGKKFHGLGTTTER